MAGLFLIIDVCILCITNQPTFLVCHLVVLYTAGTIRLVKIIMFKTGLNKLEYPTMNIFEIPKRLYKTFPFLLFLSFYCKVENLKCMIGIDTNVWNGKKCFICRKSVKHSHLSTNTCQTFSNLQIQFVRLESKEAPYHCDMLYECFISTCVWLSVSCVTASNMCVYTWNVYREWLNPFYRNRK